MEITIKATPEEMAVLLCELKSENETTPISYKKNAGTTIEDVFGGAEFIRKARECGRVNF